MAIIRRSDFPENLDLIVEVIEAAPMCCCIRCNGMPAWVCETKGRHIVGFALGIIVATSTISDIPDADLQPIRNPGDDEVDEELLRIGAPNYGEVAA